MPHQCEQANPPVSGCPPHGVPRTPALGRGHGEVEHRSYQVRVDPRLVAQYRLQQRLFPLQPHLASARHVPVRLARADENASRRMKLGKRTDCPLRAEGDL